jgi:hypothetical protein
MSLTPKELIQNYEADVARWLSNSHTSHEVCHTLSKLDQDLARQIYLGCQSKPEDLEHYLRTEAVVSRLLPAVLGAFSAKCAICGCDARARAEIRAALLMAKRNSVMFPMVELDGWYRSVKQRMRECSKRHGYFELWKLLRVLKTKVAKPQPAKLETEYYQ